MHPGGEILAFAHGLGALSAPASNHTPGVEARETTAVRMPALSICSIDFAGVQSNTPG